MRLSQVTKGIAVESNIAAEAEAVREALLGGPQLEKVARLAVPGFGIACMCGIITRPLPRTSSSRLTCSGAVSPYR